MTKGPVLIDMQDQPLKTGPDSAPPPPDLSAAMPNVIALTQRKPSRLVRLFWSTFGALVVLILSVSLWDFANALMERWAPLGWAMTGILGLLGLLAFLFVLRELATLSRLRRIDTLSAKAQKARADNDLQSAKSVVADIHRFYETRRDTTWGRARLSEREGDQFDAETLFDLVEITLFAPLDEAAAKEVEAAARQIAVVTAVVPLALADVVAALTVNIRMIRRIAEIYGARASFLGSWRLLRAVIGHLVATGAVAVGDDLITSVAGGGVLSKLSRRFGEGIVNGALTARVGVAAMEVCRPLPFNAVKRPSVTQMVKKALTGLWK